MRKELVKRSASLIRGCPSRVFSSTIEPWGSGAVSDPRKTRPRKHPSERGRGGVRWISSQSIRCIPTYGMSFFIAAMGFVSVSSPPILGCTRRVVQMRATPPDAPRPEERRTCDVARWKHSAEDWHPHMDVFVRWVHWRMGTGLRPACDTSLELLDDLDMLEVRRQLTFSHTDPWRARVLVACPELWRLGSGEGLRKLVEREVCSARNGGVDD